MSRVKIQKMLIFPIFFKNPLASLESLAFHKNIYYKLEVEQNSCCFQDKMFSFLSWVEITGIKINTLKNNFSVTHYFSMFLTLSLKGPLTIYKGLLTTS